MALFGVEIRGDGAGQRTKNSRSELEVPLARKATTIARLSEPWIKAESTLSAFLCGIISTIDVSRTSLGGARAMWARLTLRASAMPQPCSRGTLGWGH